MTKSPYVVAPRRGMGLSAGIHTRPHATQHGVCKANNEAGTGNRLFVIYNTNASDGIPYYSCVGIDRSVPEGGSDDPNRSTASRVPPACLRSA